MVTAIIYVAFGLAKSTFGIFFWYFCICPFALFTGSDQHSFQIICERYMCNYIWLHISASFVLLLKRGKLKDVEDV